MDGERQRDRGRARRRRLPAFVWLACCVLPAARGETPEEAAAAKWKAELAERSRWWSLQPPKNVEPPEVSDGVWNAEPVDRFVRAKLSEAGLSPAAPAGPETLLRRLSFVLTGLPPKPERTVAFRESWERDPDTALAGAVDELLASPHFGERFARHWMDVVRYTDTYGYEWDNPAKGSWEYRDYLIRAFNGDVGFDRLIREQLAGDLLPDPRIDSEQGTNESLIGPMFYHMGEHRHGNSLMFNGIHQEMIDNKIDAFSKAFLAMTVACARCHDHKLDAISQRDYYALAGIFMTPRWTSRIIDAPGKHAAEIGELKRLRGEIRDTLAAAWTSNRAGLQPGALRRWAASNREAIAKLPIEAVAHPLAAWLAADDANADARWNRLAEAWKTERARRKAENAAKFTVLTDFAEPGFPENWVVEGAGIEQGWVPEATLLVALDGDAAVEAFLDRGYHTRALSSKLPGAIRLPARARFSGKFVSLRLAGGEWAGRLEVPQNAFQNEGPVFFDPASPPGWATFSGGDLKNGVTRVLTEIATASLHPNFPPRTGVARMGKTALPDDDFGHDKRSWFSLTGVISHESPGAPSDELDAFAGLYRLPAPKSADEGWERLSDWLTDVLDRWIAREPDPGDVPALNWMLRAGGLANDAASPPEVAVLVSRYRETEARIGFPRSANGMDERGIEPLNYRLNVRGNVDEDGPEVPRGFLEVFGKLSAGTSDFSTSGRLELANFLGGRGNPQTARVFVNRVWQWVFGRGLVDTPSDFGKLGGRPSHPELLDWLAIRFMEEGWSTKELIRRLVLSRTFRQSGEAVAPAAERDPDNRLLHCYATRRLEAEAVRDSLLAVSGRLDPRLFGRPIDPPRAVEDSKKRLFSGPLDGNGRRSIYLKMSIMDPPKFLVGFNLPDLKLPTGRRDVTNVPGQALILLNDPMVNALAEGWAGRLVDDGAATPEERIDAMFLAAFGREASAVERKRWAKAAAEFGREESVDLMGNRSAWAAVAHALFNAKEFLYVR
ncbi:MAG: DUF1553 domain-containing protein [Akkermansiaceae bacterium]|nr:DUF1553 domain-containing protein [Akkermansiaceae bacterium]MCP5549911.1 DUF1553 domain-containing protein [Akkermansiaceae bacterium]